MEAIFPFVVYGGIALFVLVGVLSMLSRNNNLYDQIGQGGLTLGDDRSAVHRGGAPAEPGDFDALAGFESAHRAEREQEIRQMLQARSDRRVRSGEAPLDIDAELAKLEQTQRFGSAPLGPAGEGTRDSGLAIEVRQLVLARNERRLRQGQPALDVETEVARTLAELSS